MREIPLRRQGKVVIPDLFEIALFPTTSVDECDVILGKGYQRVGPSEIGSDGVRMLVRITHDVGHSSLLPALVNVTVAALACFRSYVMSPGQVGSLPRWHRCSRC